MKTKMQSNDWVEFYCNVCDEMLRETGHEELTETKAGDVRYTDDAQEMFETLVTILESHMEEYFEKVDDPITPEQGIANVCADLIGTPLSQTEVDTLLSAKTGGMFSDGAVSMDSYGANDD